MAMRFGLVFVSLGCFALLGCSTSSAVPKDAKLLYHGPALGENTFTTPKGAGTFYYVDDKRGDVVAAMYWAPGETAAFDHVSIEGPTISVYFSADPTAESPVP